MTFPDGESVIYAYDYGGRLMAVSGSKGGVFERYVRDIAYDEFGSRTRLRYGNDAASEYEYDPLTRRLTGLVTTAGGKTVQNLEYDYDRAGNILMKTNRGFFSAGGAEATSEQTYGYDDLHRLISSEGEYRDPKGVNTYTNDFTYDTIGNILTKVQANDFDPAEGPSAPVPGTTYTFNYTYGAKPHAVTSTGDTTYTYDAGGNMTAMKGPAVDRTITWDEENRVTKTLDGCDETLYAYDDGGIRAIKRGKYGETFYAGENLSIRNGTIESKHIFAGNARVVTKVTNKGKEAGTYYYHGDHLGSSNSITTRTGSVHENIEYFPYGETWVHSLLAKAESLPFRFSGKEYDPETGWYYYGLRYYDSKVSRWISADPALPSFMPYDDRKNSQLPGLGGVYNPVNLSLYNYTSSNPICYIDPDGGAAVPVWVLVLGGAALAMDAYDIYDAFSEGDGGQIAFAVGVTALDAASFGSGGWVRRAIVESQHIARAGSSAYSHSQNPNSTFRSTALTFVGTYAASRVGSAAIRGVGQQFWSGGRALFRDGIKIYEPSRRNEAITKFIDLGYTESVKQVAAPVANNTAQRGGSSGSSSGRSDSGNSPGVLIGTDPSGNPVLTTDPRGSGLSNLQQMH